MLSLGSRFAKRFTKMASAPLVELFVELKLKKNGFTSEAKPCQTEPNISFTLNQILIFLTIYLTFFIISQHANYIIIETFPIIKLKT